jgi:hypothetical protein
MANDGTLGGVQAQSAASIADQGALGSTQLGVAATDADNRGLLGTTQLGVAATDADNRGFLAGIATQVVLVGPLTTAVLVQARFDGEAFMTADVVIPALSGDTMGSWQGVRLSRAQMQGRRKPQGRRLGG